MPSSATTTSRDLVCAALCNLGLVRFAAVLKHPVRDRLGRRPRQRRRLCTRDRLFRSWWWTSAKIFVQQAECRLAVCYSCGEQWRGQDPSRSCSNLLVKGWNIISASSAEAVAVVLNINDNAFRRRIGIEDALSAGVGEFESICNGFPHGIPGNWTEGNAEPDCPRGIRSIPPLK